MKPIYARSAELAVVVSLTPDECAYTVRMHIQGLNGARRFYEAFVTSRNLFVGETTKHREQEVLTYGS